MDNDTSQYKIISTQQCMGYIEQFGLTIHDNSEYTIMSKSGLVYILPNKEVVLLPTNFDLEYPGIVFKNIEIFKQYAKLDFFPIGKENMTWFERHNKELEQFRIKQAFYTVALSKLGIALPLKNVEEIKSGFLKVQSFTVSTKPRDFSFEQVNLIYSFGLAVTDYMVDFKGYKLITQKNHENYNPITKVLVEKDGLFQDVLYTCQVFIESDSQDSFLGFCRSLNLN